MEVHGLVTHALQLQKRIIKITRLANCFAMQISSLIGADDPGIGMILCNGSRFCNGKAQCHSGNPFIWKGVLIDLGRNGLKWQTQSCQKFATVNRA